MNWLAHVLLSDPTVEFRLGNLLADLVRGDDLSRMSEDFKRGAACHKAIDAFTDAHPVVRRSRARIAAPYRRFSGVLVDIFYDYCLASRWQDHVAVSLSEFTAEFYAAVRTHPLTLPEAAATTLNRIVTRDLLGQYARIDGVAHSLRRVSAYLSHRWRRDFQLEQGVHVLREQEGGFLEDFAEFFPQLQAHVSDRNASRVPAG